MLALAKPKFFVPVHGEHRMLVCHSRSAQIMGVPKDNILIIENGDVVELTPDSIKKGDPLFLDSQGIIHKYDGDQFIWPVFIGEVAYKEKKIAMSYTKKEVIYCQNEWIQEFESL